MLLPAPAGGSHLNLQNEGPHIPPQAQICLQREAGHPFGLLDSKSSIATPPPGLLHTGTHLGGANLCPKTVTGEQTLPLPQLHGSCRAAPAEASKPPTPASQNHTTAPSCVANPTCFNVVFFFFPAIAQKRALLTPRSEGAVVLTPAYPLLTYSRSQTFH